MTKTRIDPRVGPRIGLIVNPVAGMGGAVGLKGTDGDRASRARQLGATPLAAERAEKALAGIADWADGADGAGSVAENIEWLSCAGNMGADSLEAAGYAFETVYEASTSDTSAFDTRTAAKRMLDRDVDLLLFAGGDGTAADLLAVVGDRVPVLGIPAGVKMHSAVFAVTPRAAGRVAHAFAVTTDRAALTGHVEIMDRPADSGDAASPQLLGYVRSPVLPSLVVHAKAASVAGSVEGACRYAVERIRDAGLVLIGPGVTMLGLKRELGVDGTLLGVDAVKSGRPIAKDLNASQILELLDSEADDSQTLIVVTIVGGQGFLFGRGNQQLSAEVLRRVGRDNIIVVSSMEKLLGLPERRLLVDTGDEATDEWLAGYMPVVVGFRRILQLPVGMPRSGREQAGKKLGIGRL